MISSSKIISRWHLPQSPDLIFSSFNPEGVGRPDLVTGSLPDEVGRQQDTDRKLLCQSIREVAMALKKVGC
jgi:hypothetical protein